MHRTDRNWGVEHPRRDTYVPRIFIPLDSRSNSAAFHCDAMAPVRRSRLAPLGPAAASSYCCGAPRTGPIVTGLCLSMFHVKDPRSGLPASGPSDRSWGIEHPRRDTYVPWIFIPLGSRSNSVAFHFDAVAPVRRSRLASLSQTRRRLIVLLWCSTHWSNRHGTVPSNVSRETPVPAADG